MRGLALLPFLLVSVVPACVSSSDARSASVEEASSSPSRGDAAFVVVTRAETVVIPLDRDAPVLRQDGVWIQDDGSGRVLRPPPSPESRGLAQCQVRGSDRECSFEFPVVLERELDFDFDADCSCIITSETETCGEDPFEALGLEAWEASSGVTWSQLEARRADSSEDGAEDDYEGDDEECSESGSEPVSLHAGVLYDEVFEHNECGGMNLYGTYATAAEMTSDAIPIEFDRADEIACDHDGAFLDGWARPEAATEYFRRDGRWYVPEDASDADFELEQCDRFVSATAVPFNRGSDVLLVGVDVDGMGSGPLFSQRRPFAEAQCTDADPCGDPHDFALAGGGTAQSPLFVASDETAALRVDGDDWTLFAPASPDPVRSVTIEGTLVGVRFHRDARRIARAMSLEASHHVTARECARGLVLVDGECQAQCTTALDCRATGRCDSLCVEGVCSDAVAECADGHPCGAGAVCEQNTCRELALAAADAEFEDTRGGTGWGNRCIAHLRAGRLDAAEAACAAGLRDSSRAGTRGALLFNLGLVNERRGRTFEARLYYEASLSVRPNPVAERSLAALGGPVGR